MTQEAILSRINKLLAIQEARGATEAEAAIAAEHVQRLLQEHNLTLSQIEAAGGSSDGDSGREKKVTTRKAMYEYQKSLMIALAENNFCLHRISEEFVKSYWGKKFKVIDGELVKGHYEKRHTLVGRVVNVRVTEATYDYLIDALKYQAKEAGFQLHKLTREMFWFYEGAVKRLRDRLAEQRRSREAETEVVATQGNGTHRELVLSDVYGNEFDLNNDTLNGYPLGTTATRRRESEAREAMRSAKEAELVEQGVERTKAFYLSHGYGEEDAARYANNWNNRRQSQRGGRGRSHSWTQDDENRRQKVNSDAYKAGLAAGDTIGLDPQMTRTSRKSLPKE